MACAIHRGIEMKGAASIILAGLLVRGAIAASPLPSTPWEQAEFLAGIPLPKKCSLHALQKSPEYRAHQQELRQQWTFCRSLRYDAMQQWGRENLSGHPMTRSVLRYLFGGPDFLNAYAFFPDTRVMVLGGLEPVGDVPPPEALDPEELGKALSALRESLHTSLFCGYFITSEMKPQLAQGSFRGVLPVLYTELALTGNVIDSVQMVRPFGSPGVQIIYHRPGGTAQTLYYFRADLSNGKECRNFLSWLEDLGPGASYLKAASYLLPLDSFSMTRNFLTKTSGLILQDDSGIPYRSFLPGEWKIRLFGVYTEPLEIFRLKKDPLLTEAFESSLRIAPLPFGAGYHVNAPDANLLLAVRNTPPGLSATPVIAADNAPPAVPAFATPTPRQKPVRIRKALPVPIRKAIPVNTPVAEQVEAPVLPPAPVAVEPAPPAPTPQVMSTPVVPPQEELPQSSQPPRTSEAIGESSPEQATSAPPETESAPMTTPPATEETPPPQIPLTSDGKPID